MKQYVKNELLSTSFYLFFVYDQEIIVFDRIVWINNDQG